MGGGHAIEQQAGMQQVFGTGVRVTLSTGVCWQPLQVFPVLNAVGKTCPLRGEQGHRDKHVLKPAGIHERGHFSELRLM